MDKSDIFNYATGVLAVLSILFSSFRWAKTRLPHSQMKSLDNVSHQARQLYNKSDEEGLLPREFRLQFETELLALERSREVLRERTYRTMTILEQVVASFRGLSMEIMRLSDEAKRLRAKVTTRSEESRRLRDATSADPAPSGIRDHSLSSEVTLIVNDAAIQGSVDESVMPSAEYCQPSSSQATLVQPVLQVSGARMPSALTVDAVPKACWSTHPMWARLWERSWKWTFSHPPQHDIESGTRTMDMPT